MHRIGGELIKRGYEKWSVGPSGVSIFVKRQEDNNYFIFFVNLPEQLPDDVQGLIDSLQQLKYNVSIPGVNRCLFVYLTDEPDKLKCLCEDTIDVHWIFNRNNQKLIIYENQPDNFDGIKTLIENGMFIKEQKKKFSSYATASLITINVLIFIVMYYKIYFVWGEQSKNVLINQVGLFWPAVICGHEYWRLITSMFVHSGAEHLINNMTLLCFAGMLLEERIGHVKFILLYFISGILAGLVSMSYNILNEKLIVSIGASGAIFGIVGALACFICFSKTMKEHIKSTRLFIFIGLSIYCGAGGSDVDNMAHIGGLIAGFLMAWIMLRISEKK